MKRRDVLKGAAVAAGAAVVGLPAVAEGEALPLLNTTYSVTVLRTRLPPGRGPTGWNPLFIPT